MDKQTFFAWLDEWAILRGVFPAPAGDEISSPDEYGSVVIDAIQLHRAELLAVHSEDQEIRELIEAEPQRYLWIHDDTTPEQRRAIDVNNGEREAFIPARMGGRRFVTAYDHYVVNDDGTVTKGDRIPEIAVAYQTRAGEAAGLGNYTPAEIAEIENTDLTRRIRNLLKGREERAAGAQT